MCPFRVRLPLRLKRLAGFLGGMITLAVAHRPGGGGRTVRFGSGGVLHCRHQLLHPSTRNSVCGRRFHYRVTASLRGASDGMLTVSSICIASRLIIRHRLTPGRTTLPGNPWSYGGGESHPPYRYLYLHLLFRKLQRASRHTFTAAGMLPYRRQNRRPTASARVFIPDYYPCPTPRLVSCYALFE